MARSGLYNNYDVIEVEVLTLETISVVGHVLVNRAVILFTTPQPQ